MKGVVKLLNMHGKFNAKLLNRLTDSFQAYILYYTMHKFCITTRVVSSGLYYQQNMHVDTQ